MTAAQNLKVYDLLNAHFGQSATSFQVVDAIGAVLDEGVSARTQTFKGAFEDYLEALRLGMHQTLVTKEDLAQLRAEVKNQTKELINRMFLFWIGQIGATMGLVLYLKN